MPNLKILGVPVPGIVKQLLVGEPLALAVLVNRQVLLIGCLVLMLLITALIVP
jgi:hypothetical protein